MWETGRSWQPPHRGAGFAAQAWSKRVGTFATSSVGRLFDAAAALILGVQEVSFEGQGPLLLESIAKPGCDPVELPLVEDADGVLRADWAPLLAVLTDDRLSAATRSGIFHESLARMAVSQACALRRKVAYDAVGLTGGVFQNKLLSERIASLLAARGIQVLRNREVPANDGGLAVGQIIEYIHAQDATEGHQRAGAT